MTRVTGSTIVTHHVDGRDWVDLDVFPRRFTVHDFVEAIVHDRGGSESLWDTTNDGSTVIGHRRGTLWLDAYDYAIQYRNGSFVLHLHPCDSETS